MTEQQQQRPEKAPPAVPPDVVTAYVILRSAIAGVLGVDETSDQFRVSELQKTYHKNPGTAKFALTFGKRLGEQVCQVLLPDDDYLSGGDDSADQRNADLERIWDAIESACDKITQQKGPIRVYQIPEADLKEAPREGGSSFPSSLRTDGNLPKPPKKKKKKKDKEGGDGEEPPQPEAPKMVCLARFEGQNSVAVLPEGGLPFADTSSVAGAKISVDRSQSSSSATSNKKSRGDCKLIVAYKVEVGAAGVDVDGMKLAEASAPMRELPKEALEAMSNREIMFAEGRALLERQKQRQNDAAAGAEESKAGAAKEAKEEEKEMVVNVEKVEGKIDYDRLVKDFGSTLITSELLENLRKKSRIPLHRFLRRNIFFSHRDLDALLTALDGGDKNKKKKKLYLYTGRGPSSSSMHLGHLIPFLFTKWLQEAFDCPLVIQMTDDEKFLFKGSYSVESGGDNLSEFAKLTIENAKDIIACGFDYDRTFLFSDLDYVGTMYPNIVRIWKAVTTNTVNGIFGFDGSSNIGKIAFPAVQAAPSFGSSFPRVLDCTTNDDAENWLCLIPCAIDQDPYFRMTRDVAHKLVPNGGKGHGLGGKPALIHSKFFPPLQGAAGKMSSSDENSAIFLTDGPDDIRRKITRHAYSGGRDTKEKQIELGADLDVDVSYQWLSFFLEDDDELEKIGREYGSGTGEYWSTGEVKRKLIEVLQQLVGDHQRRRAQITDDDVRNWMQERPIV